MDKIGNKHIVYRGSFICPQGDDISIDTNLDGWGIKLKIVFETGAKEKGVRIEPHGDHAKLVFINWDNSIGTATSQAITLGTHSDGRILFFMATNYSIGGTNKFDIQLLLGGKNE